MNWSKIQEKLKQFNLPEPAFTENAQEILAKRYLIKDEEGASQESAKDLLIRVASYVAAAETKHKKSQKFTIDLARDFYTAMVRLEFFPNSPTLRGAGREIHQLSACFVLPIEDNMESIFDTLKATALVHKGGGGTGFSFGRLRPAGDPVGSTEGVAGGPLSFMNIFDTLAREVMQGGVRVGANMGILPVDHPDIIAWIKAKADGKSFLNFNLSVTVTDDFMEKVKNGEDYDLINPHGKKLVKKLNAKKVFNLMVKEAWRTGDPGMIFIDRINRDNPTPALGKIESTNPCGEQPLLPYESCNLGSINLATMAGKDGVNWAKLKKITRLAVRFLDDVIDVNRYVLPQVKKLTHGNRKIGLGVMGFADLLAKLKIPYNSEEALELAEKIMKTIQEEGQKTSQSLAREKGVFPNFKKSIFDGQTPCRNATITTIAPTGTLSLLANCTGGIEPYFALVYTKKSIWKKDGSSELKQTFVVPGFEQALKALGLYSEELLQKIEKAGGRIQELKEIPASIKKVFVTAHDITPEWHIKMQEAFQKHTDNAVSKTINFANQATVEDVRAAYLLAYDTGLKGLTIFRDGSRTQQVFETTQTKAVPQIVVQPLPKPRARPEIVEGKTRKVNTGCGDMFVTINEDERGPFEVFCTIGKAGGCAASQNEAIGRLVSLALRSGIDPKHIVRQLIGIRCHNPYGFGKDRIHSCADAIAKAVDKYLHPKLFEEEKKVGDNMSSLPMESPATAGSITGNPGDNPGACPECGSPLNYSEGCVMCAACGYSKCS